LKSLLRSFDKVIKPLLVLEDLLQKELRMRRYLVKHSKGGTRGSQNVLILCVNKTNSESIDTEVFAETTGNVNLVLQPVVVTSILLIFLHLMLIEPNLSHRLHLLFFVKRNCIELVANQMDFFLVCPLEAHLEALGAHHFTSWSVWLR
jgi:hypothetical protein